MAIGTQPLRKSDAAPRRVTILGATGSIGSSTVDLLKRQNGEQIDQKAYEDCLRRSVVDVVKGQAEVGIDVISDGEFGKNLSWSRYVLERMGGFEERHGGGVGSIRATAGKDRREFAEFYAEYEAANGFVGMGRSFAKTGLWYVTALGLNWTLGVVSYLVLPALGPVFVEPGFYANLPETGTAALQQALIYERHEALAGQAAQSIAKPRP